MKIIEEHGDLFEVDKKKYVLAHCISADVTKHENMDAGIAKQFRARYPGMAAFIEGKLRVGNATKYCMIKNYAVHTIYSLFTKNFHYQKAYENEMVSKGRHVKFDYYDNLEKCLVDLRNQMKKSNEKYLAMPKICCGLDGGKWEKVISLIEKVFAKSKIEILIRIK